MSLDYYAESDPEESKLKKRCPKCESFEIDATITTLEKLKVEYHCNKCEHKWAEGGGI